MGLTASSTGNHLLSQKQEQEKDECAYTIAIARKSKCGKIDYF